MGLATVTGESINSRFHKNATLFFSMSKKIQAFVTNNGAATKY